MEACPSHEGFAKGHVHGVEVACAKCLEEAKKDLAAEKVKAAQAWAKYEECLVVSRLGYN